MKLLTEEQQESYENVKICCICKEKFENKYLKDKKYLLLEISIIVQGNIKLLHNNLNIVYLKEFI